jgi:uncharacterized protein YuzE
MATVAEKATQALISKWVPLATDLLKLPAKHAWLDYDSEADVLYISFRRPQRVTKTIETDDGILIRKDGGQVVGLTILNASSR